jgi:putative FmdB family regulatory protein
MPRYSYYCEDCDETYLIVHSWNSKQSTCDVCKSQKFSKTITPIKYQKNGKTTVQPRIGSVVKQTIEDTKEQIKREKIESQKRTK